MIRATALSVALRDFRLEREMTQEAMAACLGVSKHSYYLWERKGKKPAVRHLVVIADVMERSLEEVIGMADSILENM